MRDAQEQLVWDAAFSCAVLGNAKGEFVLSPLDCEGNPLTDAELERAHEKGFQYCGVMGVLNGVASAKCDPDPVSVAVMMLAAPAFAELVANKLKPKADCVWLQRLWDLPDTREN